MKESLPRLVIGGSGQRRNRKPVCWYPDSPPPPRIPDKLKFATWPRLRKAGYARDAIMDSVDRLIAKGDYDAITTAPQATRGGLICGQKLWFRIKSELAAAEAEAQAVRDFEDGMCGGDALPPLARAMYHYE